LHAEGDGIVEFVDAREIVIRYDRDENERIVSFEDDTKRYKLTKFQRTNQSTSINLRPIVNKGDKVVKGQVLCEGYATKDGVLALGRNLQVAFMPWKGYNYEDAIVISEKVVKEDIFTSVHVEEFITEVRETKRGLEELTRDIPNVSTEATKDLDENGMIRIGAEVKEGDILVGKITPKGESDPTPEEKLLRAIFGDKAGDVKDASLKVPPSISGVVIDKKLFTRFIKDKKSRQRDNEIVRELKEKYELEEKELKTKFIDKLFVLLTGKVSEGVYSTYGEEYIPKKTKFNQKLLLSIDYNNLASSDWTTDPETNELVKEMLNNYNIKCREIQGALARQIYASTIGDDLPSGIVQMAKIQAFLCKIDKKV
jgi:DNA-directed RNA polymerase subunit beta